MLDKMLQDRYQALRALGGNSWFAPLRERAWNIWRDSPIHLPAAWVKEFERAASPAQATSAAVKAAQDSRVMWRRMATQAAQKDVAQQEGFIDTLRVSESSYAFFEQRLHEGDPLVALQMALVADAWCVQATAGARFMEPLQPPPALSLWDELFSFHAVQLADDAEIEVVSGCMAPKGARSLLLHVDLGMQSKMRLTSMHHAPESAAEWGCRDVHLEKGARLTWHDVRLNAGHSLRTSAQTDDEALFAYRGLWGARAPEAIHLDWLDVGDLWLLGDVKAPQNVRAKLFALPELSWPWRVVRVTDDVWRLFCLEQFLLPFLQNLPVEYQADVIRFAELSYRSS